MKEGSCSRGFCNRRGGRICEGAGKDESDARVNVEHASERRAWQSDGAVSRCRARVVHVADVFWIMCAASSAASTSWFPRALHVLRVTPSSPASLTNIEPYFDFLVGFKDEKLASKNIDAAELERIVEDHEGRPLDLLVWNSKSQSVRGKLADL